MTIVFINTPTSAC